MGLAACWLVVCASHYLNVCGLVRWFACTDVCYLWFVVVVEIGGCLLVCRVCLSLGWLVD